MDVFGSDLFIVIPVSSAIFKVDKLGRGVAVRLEHANLLHPYGVMILHPQRYSVDEEGSIFST